jgi:hypothetical protein
MVLLVLAMGACSRSSDGTSTSLVAVVEGENSGIAGTMQAPGSSSVQGEPVSGQILIWRTTEELSSSTSTGSAFSRPLAAVYVKDGEFEIDLDPGWYIVRATAIGGIVCGETPLEVTANNITVVGFSCTGP